jgi:NTP pyrophosphatase (non-canonical NTP hydrolase)
MSGNAAWNVRAASAIWETIKAERERAHTKHGESSMEFLTATDPIRLTVLVEEVGEVAKVLNDGRHKGQVDFDALRMELVQVAAMAAAWADVVPDAP